LKPRKLLPLEEYRAMLKMFILIRRDILPLAHCAVQSSHSAAEFMAKFGNKPNVIDWVNNHKTMILLSASEKDIADIKVLYDRLGLSYATFIEPDMSNAETATAFEPISNDISKDIFGKLKLLS
jgi:peptidyl-tRNA hydrolase